MIQTSALPLLIISYQSETLHIYVQFVRNTKNIVSMIMVMAVWHSGSMLASINEVTLCQAQLVLGWVTGQGFSSQCRKRISVYKQPPRSSPVSRYNEYQPKDGDALWLGIKRRYGSCGVDR